MSDQQNPLVIDETAGVKYYCGCGNSKNGPYCDGSHKGTDKTPFEVNIEKDKKVFLCNCSKTKKQPFCDGSHKN